MAQETVMNRQTEDDVWRQIHGESTTCAQQVPSLPSDLEKPKVLFVFESPAEYEIELNRPVTGATGASLCVLCDMVRLHLRPEVEEAESRLSSIVKGFCTRKAIIVNVSHDSLKRDEVPISASELRKEEFQEYENTFIGRMKAMQGLESIEVAVFFGELAWRVRERLINTLKGSKVPIRLGIECYHLSWRGLRNIKLSRLEDEGSKRLQQLSVLAEYLSERLRNLGTSEVERCCPIGKFREWQNNRREIRMVE